MSIESVREYFMQWNMEDKIKQFPVSSATVELAAAALSCKPERIAKTLSFKIGERAVLVVTAGDAKVDNAKFKAKFRKKPKMMAPEEVEDLIGHSIGGVCPFGVREGVEVYLDSSLKRFDTVFPACGSSSSAIELTIKELEFYSSNLEWVDVCTNWQGAIDNLKSQVNTLKRPSDTVTSSL